MTVGFNNGGGERSWRQTATGSVLRSGVVAARITVQPGGQFGHGDPRAAPLGMVSYSFHDQGDSTVHPQRCAQSSSLALGKLLRSC